MSATHPDSCLVCDKGQPLQKLIDELAGAPKGGTLAKDIEIAGRMIAALKKDSSCDGVHITAIGKEEVVPDILAAAGL